MGSHRAERVRPPAAPARARHAGHRRRSRVRLLPGVLALVLLLALGALTGVLPQPGGDDRPGSPARESAAFESASGATPAPSPSPSPSAAPSPSAPTSAPPRTVQASPARPAGDAPVAQEPRLVRLPSGRSVQVMPVGTRPGGDLDVPDSVADAGWWRGGSRLGDPFGALLLAAHVDSRTEGLGPFAELLGARSGQRVTVQSAGLTQTFRLTSRSVIPRERLVGQRQIFAVDGPARLVLVTCAGPYDRERGGYLNLAVLTAEPVAPVSRRDA